MGELGTVSGPAERERGAVLNEVAELGESGGDWGTSYRARKGRTIGVDENGAGFRPFELLRKHNRRAVSNLVGPVASL